MQETWRWFGPEDPVTLRQVKQTGATGIVSALDNIPTGEAWPLADILERKRIIEEAGLVWSVVESVPVHNAIKSRTGDFERMIENYKISLRNLGQAGIETVCYNFMPVVDWTRTSLSFEAGDNSVALKFEMTDFAAYDIFVLQREGVRGQAGVVERIEVDLRQREQAADDADVAVARGQHQRGGLVGRERVDVGAGFEDLLDLRHVALGGGEEQDDVDGVLIRREQRVHAVVRALVREDAHVVEVVLHVLGLVVVAALRAHDAGFVGVLRERVPRRGRLHGGAVGARAGEARDGLALRADEGAAQHHARGGLFRDGGSATETGVSLRRAGVAFGSDRSATRKGHRLLAKPMRASRMDRRGARAGRERRARNAPRRRRRTSC